MSWAELHRASEAAAIEAEQQFRNGKLAEAALRYREAAEFEQRALREVDASKARTRGITAVSAVSLWYKAAAYDQAEQLAYLMLSEPILPVFAKNQLRDLVQAIWTESSKQAAHVNFLPGQVFVSVKGGEVITGGAPLDLIVQKVQTIQSMFYRTVEFMNDIPFRTTGLPDRGIQDACRPWLFQAPPGSYQFAVAIQEPKQADLFREGVRPDLVATRFFEVLKAAASDDPQHLAAVVPKPEYRKAFLSLSRNLAPTGKTFGSIEFRTATGESRVALTPESRTAINQIIRDGRPPAVESSGVEEEVTGILRAVDLEKDFLDVLVNGQPLHVVGLEDAMDDVIGPMVNKAVKVRIVRGAKGARFRDIELDE